MKFLLTCVVLFLCLLANAQADSSIIKKPDAKALNHEDSMYLSRLNTGGNLMIAGGVGMCGAGAYLVYYGLKTYNTAAGPGSTTPVADEERNRKQGTVLTAVGGIAIAGGIALTTFGAIRKHEFKVRKRMMSMEAGLSPDGRIVATLHF